MNKDFIMEITDRSKDFDEELHLTLDVPEILDIYCWRQCTLFT